MSRAKIFTDIITSPLNEEDLEVRWLAMVLLLQCNRNGQVRATPDGLGRLANMTAKQTEKAMKRLVVQEDDLASVKPDEIRVFYLADNWWQIVHYGRYRDVRDIQAQREATRLRVQKHRERKRKEAEAHVV